MSLGFRFHVGSVSRRQPCRQHHLLLMSQRSESEAAVVLQLSRFPSVGSCQGTVFVFRRSCGSSPESGKGMIHGGNSARLEADVALRWQTVNAMLVSYARDIISVPAVAATTVQSILECGEETNDGRILAVIVNLRHYHRPGRLEPHHTHSHVTAAQPLRSRCRPLLIRSVIMCGLTERATDGQELRDGARDTAYGKAPPRRQARFRGTV